MDLNLTLCVVLGSYLYCHVGKIMCLFYFKIYLCAFSRFVSCAMFHSSVYKFISLFYALHNIPRNLRSMDVYFGMTEFAHFFFLPSRASSN